MKTDASPRQLRREREQASRRSEVVAAASAVFAEKGFFDTQIAEIARICGLSLASIYALFEGKDDLYQEVVRTAAIAVIESVQRAVEAVSDPAERLLAVVDSMFVCFERDNHLIQIYARGTHGVPWHTRQVMGDETMAIFRSFRQWVSRLAADAKRSGYLRDIDDETFAVSMIGAVTRTATHWVEEYPDRPLSEAGPAVHEIFLRAIGRGA